VDITTVALLVFAAIPWLSVLFRKIDLPGGFSVEYADLKETEAAAERTGSLPPAAIADKSSELLGLAAKDPLLALATLRLRIEQRLKELGRTYSLDLRPGGIRRWMIALQERNGIDLGQYAVLADLTSILNSAAHGESPDPRTTAWALDAGQRILDALDKRIRERELDSGTSLS
jgi:hypothetical protein